MQQLRTHILFCVAVTMIGSLFISRTFLAIAIPVFVLVSIADDPLKQVKNFFATPILWSISLLFLLPFLSGAWSKDLEQWRDIILLKSPLLLLSFSFASDFRFTKWHWNGLAIVFILTVTGGTCWSAAYYFSHIADVNAGYLQAKSLVTPLGNDHVRFSLLVFIAIVTGSWMFYRNRNNRFSGLLLFIIAWLICYLHILAARTGLLCFYLGLIVAGIYYLVNVKRRTGFIWLVSIYLALPLIAWATIGSLQNKWKYFNYEWPYMRNTAYLPGANDVVRVISIKAGWKIMKAVPLAGCGFGDLRATCQQWYDIHYPGMLESDKILPSSEWMIYGAAAGIPGLILFGMVMMIPFIVRSRYRLPWLVVSIAAELSLLTDIGLEVQYGVFIHSFVFLWWWKWLKDENA